MATLRWQVLLFAGLLACSNPTSGGNGTQVGGGGDPDGAAFGDGTVLDGKGVSDAEPLSDAASQVTDSSGGDDTGFYCFSEGATACFSATIQKVCVEGQWQGQKCPTGEVCQAGKCGKPTSCTAGEIQGCDGLTMEIVCDASGKALITKKCPGTQQCAAGKCRDVVCTPGFAECVDQQTIKTCLEDGSGYGDATKCKSGTTCFGNKCLSLCETNLKVSSNKGCEYWIADLDNEKDTFSAALHPKKLTPDMIPHSVIVSNPGMYDAEITLTIATECPGGTACEPELSCGGYNTECKVPAGVPYDLKYKDNIVKAGASKEFKLPVLNVDGTGIFRKAVQLKSTQPVVAFQFNPFNSENAASNDGSLLLPVNTLGKVYYAVGWPSFPDGIAIPGLPTPSQKGYLTVVAVKPKQTKVTITLTTKGYAAPGKGVPQDGSQVKYLDAGKPYTFTLNQFEILNIAGASDMFAKVTDLTGSKVEADQAVSVFVGHEEAVVGPLDSQSSGTGQDPNGSDGCCAEHVEEQLMPWEYWGSEAFCAKTKPRGNDPDIWTVVAGEDNVTLKTIPSIKGLDGKVLAKAGDSVRVQADVSFYLQGTGKIQVAQMILSRAHTTDFTGDPTLMIVPPKKQYREDYVIQTADGYGKNWATVVRPQGLQVKVDGQPIAGASFSTFGDGTWEIAYVEVQKGTHTFESDKPFGLMVYGYGNATAYGYPGGMNLQ